jgi:hypothetical protein
VQTGNCFFDCNVSNRTGVDPAFQFTPQDMRIMPTDKLYQLTSDNFFAIASDSIYDLIYIDGLHLYSQVVKDLLSSVARLSRNGYILIDDIIPSDCFSTMEDPLEAIKYRRLHSNNQSGAWHGTTYKIFPFIYQYLLDFSFVTLYSGHLYDGDALTVLHRRDSGHPRTPMSSVPIQPDTYDFLDTMKNISFYNLLCIDQIGDTAIMEALTSLSA